MKSDPCGGVYRKFIDSEGQFPFKTSFWALYVILPGKFPILTNRDIFQIRGLQVSTKGEGVCNPDIEKNIDENVNKNYKVEPFFISTIFLKASKRQIMCQKSLKNDLEKIIYYIQLSKHTFDKFFTWKMLFSEKKSRNFCFLRICCIVLRVEYTEISISHKKLQLHREVGASTTWSKIWIRRAADLNTNYLVD